MKEYIKNFFLVLGSFLVAVLLLELALRIVYSEKQFSPPSLTATIDHMTQETHGCSWREMLYPHPYLDFVSYNSPRCNTNFINKLGFIGPDFPESNNSDTFDILILGGSVASHLVTYSRNHLREQLERYSSQDGRPIKAYSAAHPAWKHPQHLFAFILYQDLFDAVVSVEGYNEIARLSNPSLRIFNPGYHSYPFHNFQDMDIQWILNLGSGLKNMRSSFLLKDSYLYEFILSRLFPLMEQKLNRAITLTHMHDMMMQDPKKGHDISTYRNFLRNLESVARSNNQKLLVFFQPVVGIAKPLTQREKSYLAPSEFYELYKKIIENFVTTLPFTHNLLNIFQNEKDELYNDSVHCISKDGVSKGYDIMSHAIVEKVVSEWGLKKK